MDAIKRIMKGRHGALEITAGEPTPKEELFTDDIWQTQDKLLDTRLTSGNEHKVPLPKVQDL